MRVRVRRALAVLAGAVVLAGGTVTTLAAWQDNEYDRLPLAVSSFDVQQTLNDAASPVVWLDAENPANPAVLSLTVDGLVNAPLTPDGYVAGWVGLRTAPGSLGAEVRLVGPTVPETSSLTSALSYDASTNVTRAQCRANAIPASGPVSLVSAARLSAGSTTSAAFSLDAGGTDGGTPVGICVRLHLDAGAARSLGGTSVNPVWQFVATSKAS